MSIDRQPGQLLENVDAAARAQRSSLTNTGWWHSIDLGGGVVTPGVHPLSHFHENYARFELPQDLSGKRLLDIGCWDGFYTFEAERHGAEVVAVDCWRPETFFVARQELNSRATFHELSVYELNRDQLGTFDVVLFLGVLYHLPDPFLAIRRVCQMTTDFAVMESHVIDASVESDRPLMEFYEVDELGGQYDNWWGPNVACMVQMMRAAGFVRTKVMRHEAARAVVKGFRRFEPRPNLELPSLRIQDIVNTVMLDRRLVRRGRFALLSIFVEGIPAGTRRDSVQVEVGSYGCLPIHVDPPIASLDSPHARVNRLAAPGIAIEPAVRMAALACTQVIVPIPPGLDPGPAEVTVYLGAQRSNSVVIDLIDNGEW